MYTLRAQALRDSSVVDRLSDHQLREFVPPLKWSKYIPFEPTFKQRAFLMHDGRESFFGGAAGPGKSTGLLMCALQYADTPGYAALIIRRTYADLEKPGALIPRSHEWLRGTDAHWNGRRWSFPSGAVLDFGYLDNESDIYKYQSTEYSTICWDELTQFPSENWYRYLFSRNRRPTYLHNIPMRMRSAGNPGGVGHEWVKQRFMTGPVSYDRLFIPATLEDNPYLDVTEYEEALNELDPVTRAQLRHGDWSVRPPGQFFKRHLMPFADGVPDGARTIRMWDLAATKEQTSAYTAGARMSILDGRLYLSDMRRVRGDPGEVEQLIRHTAELDGRNIPIHIEQEPGSGGVNTIFRYQHTVLAGWAVYAYLPKHDKLTRATPLSALASSGNFYIVPNGNWVGPFYDEAESFPSGFKDQIDACSAALQVLTRTPEQRIRRL